MMRQEEYTPASILKIFINSIATQSFEKKVIRVRGKYFKKSNSPTSSGYYFDVLEDETEEYYITLCVPQKIRNNLIDGNSYILKGYFNKHPSKDGKISTNITIIDDEFSSLGYYYTDEDGKEFGIRKQKSASGYKNLGFLLEDIISGNKKPNIAIITGNHSQAIMDIYATLDNYKHYFTINEYRVNISSKTEILKASKSVRDKNYDIVLLTRGGGSSFDLNLFNDTQIAEFILTFNSIFVTAIGHADDTSLLQEISDRDFITPTDFGNYLKATFININNNIEKEKNLHEQIELLRIERIDQAKNHRKKSVILIILGIIFGLLINKFII